jgi:hypothetical protein
MLNQSNSLVPASLASLASDPALVGCTVERCDMFGEGKTTGMRVKFPNGMELSIQWHRGAYSSIGRGHAGDVPTFETACFDADGEWWCPVKVAPCGEHSDVQAWQTFADVQATARLIAGQVVATVVAVEILPEGIRLLTA